MIRQMGVQLDLEALLAVVKKIYPLFAKRGQIGVTARPDSVDPLFDAVGWLPDDALEADYSEITEPFRGTVIEDILNTLPFAYGRW